MTLKKMKVQCRLKLPEGYHVELRRGDDNNPYKLCLEPVADGFKFARNIKDFEPETILTETELMCKDLRKANIDSLLDQDGSIEVVGM